MNLAWPAATNVLAVRLDSIGDVLMTSPALRALKLSSPERRLTLLTSTVGARVAERVPEVDEVIVFDAPWMKPAPASAADEIALIERLRAGGFDAAVIFTVYSQNPLPAAHMCHLAGIPLRLAHCRENPYHLLTDWVPEIEPAQTVRHEVRRQLDLVQAVGCTTADERLSFSVPAAARQRYVRRLRRLGIDPRRPVVLIHPGASAASRRYPPESFAAAASLLALDGLQIAFTGGASEAGLVDDIRDMMNAPAWSLAGQMDVAELGAAIQGADLLITNNSGPAHVAAALGTPVVDLYALTNPQHTPWLVPSRVLYHDVPCRYCYKSVCPAGHHECLRLVAPETVVAAALELLAEREASRAERLVARARPMADTVAQAKGAAA